MTKYSKIIPIISYIYFVLPILLFVIGWCKLPIAIVGSIIIGISLYYICKNAPKLWIPQNKKEYLILLFCLIIAIIWTYSSGIGALVYQNFDHSCRNPIFELLVTHKWPVIINSNFNGESIDCILTYYIAFWLPSAVVGKIFHSIQIGYYMQIVWASLGIFLAFYYILSFLKKKSLLPIIIFIFFSGLDIVGCLITHRVDFTDFGSHLEWWFFDEQFSSFTTQLFWVFNQALPAWVMTLVLLKEKNNKNILFLYSCLLIHSTLPAIGIFPIIIYLAYKNNSIFAKKLIISFKKLKKSILNILTFQNIIGTGFILVISYFYLTNNISGGNSSTNTPNFNIFKFALILLLFIPLEVGIYLKLIWKDFKHDILLYIISIMFITYPFFKIGSSVDFCMRATIPALIILYLYIVKFFDSEHANKIKVYILTIALTIGSITPFHEINRTFYWTNQGITKAKSDLSIPNFFAYTENNTFLKYVGKKNKKSFDIPEEINNEKD